MIFAAGQVWVWTKNSGMAGEVQIDFVDQYDRLFCRWYVEGKLQKGEVPKGNLDYQVSEDGMLEEDRLRIADGEEPFLD
jgi:hypothetical protein